jgi:hypothetical protein
MTRTVGLLAGIAAVALLAGCAPVPADAWRLAPIRYDNRMDDESGPARLTDVTFPMRLAADTAGGVWGESAGSWLHLDADGVAVRRFNLGLDAPHPVNGLAALTPELLVVSAPADGASGGIHLFDTETGSWELLHSEQGLIGDVAVHDGEIHFVSFATGDDEFTVRSLDADAPATPTDATPALPWPGAAYPIEASVAIDVSPEGELHVATQAERIVVDGAGTVLDRAPHESIVPVVAVGPDGTAVWSGGSEPQERAPFHVEIGSGEAREVIALVDDCASDTLVVGASVGSTTLPFLCSPRGIAWLSADAFLVSVGGESGAVLVRVALPGS